MSSERAERRLEAIESHVKTGDHVKSTPQAPARPQAKQASEGSSLLPGVCVGAVIAACSLRDARDRKDEQDDAQGEEEVEMTEEELQRERISQQHCQCVMRIFEHYDYMQTFLAFTDEEREAFRMNEVLHQFHLLSLHPCQALPGMYVCVEQWTCQVPDEETKFGGPLTEVLDHEGKGMVEYLGRSTGRLRVWRSMHFIKPGHDLSGTMQSIVAAKTIRHVSPEDTIGVELGNCVDIVELRYTRCLMMSVPLLSALGVDYRSASTLNLGCGAGTVPLLLKTKFPEMSVHVVDIEPAVIDLARQWMGYADEKMGVKTFVRDAKEFLEDTGGDTQLYDIIYVDAYENSEVPEHLGGTPEKLRRYVELVRSRLKPVGVVASDLIFYSEADFEAGVKVWVELFGDQYIHIISAGENQAIVFAVKDESTPRHAMGGEKLREVAERVSKEHGFLYDLADLVSVYRRIPAEEPSC
eukprot:Hpha_TRINITY_DN33510_c0_g1::TRINITY_DN33510_c0_g1_i1::g.171091::m.171091